MEALIKDYAIAHADTGAQMGRGKTFEFWKNKISDT